VGLHSGRGPPKTKSSVFPSSREAKTVFEGLFQFVGTRDTSPYLCVPAALRFRREVCGGEERIYDYLEKLAGEAGEAVAAALGTEVLQEPGLKPREVSQQRLCAMVTVRLPLAYGSGIDNSSCSSPYPRLEDADIPDVVDWMQAVMVNKYKTMVPVFEYGGWLWVRLSAQIYLERSDFEWLGRVLQELCDQVGKQQMHVKLRGML
jgi:selenocysteine lyase/cysteine desulfurase